MLVGIRVKIRTIKHDPLLSVKHRGDSKPRWHTLIRTDNISIHIIPGEKG